MRKSAKPRTGLIAVSSLLAVVIAIGGCSRARYRLAADREAYDLIAEKNCDPRWHADRYRIALDPRSRYFDQTDPDHSPMPPDDPTSHQLMRIVDGKKGWKHWERNGTQAGWENPAWRAALADYVAIDADGAVKLEMNSALRLAYMHSPAHQRQLETLYMTALDVSDGRFRLETQFFGGYDAQYTHHGSLIPPQLSYSPLLRRFVVTPALDGDGVETNRVMLGRPFAANPALQAKRRFATAGELLVGFANSFVFEFTGGDANLATSLANFSFIQPLLRGAGKDVALEQLTLNERNLLANLRAYSQYRQGFYTQVAIGELGVIGPQRNGGGTNLLSYSGVGGVGGYLGLLQQLQQIRNTEDNLNLQLRTRDRLEALLANDLIDLVQVDQFRQSVERERSSLLISRNAYELSLDRFKTSALGLPPDLPVDLDDTLIRQFQLVPREATGLQKSVVSLQTRIAGLPDLPEVADLNQALVDAASFIEPVRGLFEGIHQDVARMDAVMPVRRQTMTTEEQDRFQEDRQQLGQRLMDLEQEFGMATVELQGLRAALTGQTRQATARQLVSWVARFLRLVERLVLIPARARLEAVTVPSVTLDPSTAYHVALANRLDFMNGRATLVDRWRLIQVRADALQAVMNVTADGDIRTARNNPLSFRAPTGSLRLGLEFDAPYTRLLERNAYRESLIEYQRSRRAFIQSCDSLHLGLRALLRQIDQLRENLEIQRLAVTIAIRRVDQTQLSLNPPRPAPQPGQRPPINPTTAINLLSAQTSLRDTQNGFLSAWLNYFAARLRLYRELGIMKLDAEGQWVETPLPDAMPESSAGDSATPAEELPLPPPVPTTWIAPPDVRPGA